MAFEMSYSDREYAEMKLRGAWLDEMTKYDPTGEKSEGEILCGLVFKIRLDWVMPKVEVIL